MLLNGDRLEYIPQVKHVLICLAELSPKGLNQSPIKSMGVIFSGIGIKP